MALAASARAFPETSSAFSRLPWLILLIAALLMAAVSLPLAQTGGSVAANGHGPAGPAGAGPNFDPGRLVLELILVVILICINAFFAMAEIALITIRKTRVRQLVEEGNRSAILVERLLNQPTRLMATIQTGVTLIAAFSSAIAATSAVAPLSYWLRAHSSGALARSADTIALVLVTLPVAILTLVVGEIAPKSLAVRYPDSLALLSARPIYGLQVLLSPIVAVLDWLANLVVRPLGGTASFTTPAVNEEELKMMVEASEEQGVLEAQETEMIHSILDFADTVVRKVMTPRIDITAVEVSAPLSELVRLINESGHSRLPVYEGDLDNIVGIVHAKDLLKLPPDVPRAQITIREVMRPPYFIPETKKIDELLAEFRRSKQQIALVRDEYGTITGVVTIEDLLEEIVGDIQDEYDVEEPMVQVINAHTTILNGKMPLSDVNDRLGLGLPEEEADTIGGFVFSLLGHQAEQGEVATWDGIQFKVEATDGRRIQKVRVIRPPEPPPTEGDGTVAAPVNRPEQPAIRE